jgi:hypothetical protein
LDEGISDTEEDIEAAGTYQESPVQIIDLLEDQAAQERCTLLYQQTEILMKWMQDDPYLFIGPAVSNTIQSVLMDSNDPRSTVPDNAHGLGNPEPATFLIDPSEEGTTQPEIGWVSIETYTPNPLSTLIHIYNDDKSLEPAYDTSVRVQEEKGIEKTTSPKPEAQDK